MASSTHEPASPALHPERALVTPVWIAALVLLIVNDHYLKGSGLLPGVVTGKLSDFAGLIVAPVLLASLLRVSDRSRLMACHVAVGIVFAGIQLSVPFADRWSGLMGLLGHPWTITSDPTDLIALPMLALAWWLLLPTMQRPLRVGLQQMAVASFGLVGLWATVATSDDGGGWDDGWDGTGDEWYEDIQAALVINNANDHDVALYVRPLRSEVTLDCAEVASDPGRMLPQQAFGEAVHWVLPGRTNLPIVPEYSVECSAVWVSGEGIPPQILFWMNADWYTQTYRGQYFDLADLPVAATAVVFDGSGPATWHAGEDFRFTPPVELPELPDSCESSEWNRIELDPSLPIGRALELVERDYGPDGCFELELVDSLEPANTWVSYLCVPEQALPFAVGEWIMFNTLPMQGGEWLGVYLVDPVTHVELQDAQGRYVRHSVLVRGASALPGIEQLLGQDLQAAPRVSCPWQPDEHCASTEQPFDVRVADTAQLVAPGDEEVLFDLEADYERGFTLVHGRRQAVLDGACEIAELGVDIDVVLTGRTL